jgi:epoxyqueuosine reductase QueG
MDLPEILEASLREAGLSAYGLLSEERLKTAFADLGRETRSRYALDRGGGGVAVALAYGEGPAEPPAWAAAYPGPPALIARFARANWYAELSARLASAAASARAALVSSGADPGPARDWRRLVNSGLPEKRLALEAGLGRLGRHCLLMLPEAGSAAVIGLLLTPFGLPDSADPPSAVLDADCERCGACVAACPTGALKGDGSLERARCLQHWSSLPGPLPPAVEAAWGGRLYGCDTCQEACPRFRPDRGAETARGLLGPGLPASWIASASEGEIRAALKGSALGRTWISPEALKRNAGHLTRAAEAPTMTVNGGLNGKL